MADVLDQSNHTGSTGIGFGDTGNGRDYMCQGFVPGAGVTNISAVSFYVNSKDANTNIGYRVWIDTCDANSNPANGVGGIGGSTLITNAQINTSGLTKYALASPVTLILGNKYVMVFAPWDTVNNIWANSYHDWLSSTANPYAPSSFSGAKRVHLDNNFANPSAPDSGNDDIQFETYYNPTLITALDPIKSHINLRPAVFKPGFAR